MTEAKQSYWTEFCKMRYQNQKTCIKYGQMLNLSPLVIRLRKTKEEYQDTVPNQCHYLNSPIQYNEFLETWESFASNITTVGIDGISY